MATLSAGKTGAKKGKQTNGGGEHEDSIGGEASEVGMWPSLSE